MYHGGEVADMKWETARATANAITVLFRRPERVKTVIRPLRSGLWVDVTAAHYSAPDRSASR